MKSMKFPEALMDEASTLKMLTIIFPCTIKKVKPNHFKSERNLLIQIFRENCNLKRSKFFMDPLIKFLWNNIFMLEAPDIVHNHLRAIRSDPSYGEDPTRKLVQCFNHLNETFGAKFTPLTQPLNHMNVLVFSDKEYLEYLQENGKFNKKQRTDVEARIKELE